MRIKQGRLKQYHLKPAVPKKDNEGSTYIEYGEPIAFSGVVWPAGGKLQAEIYGQRLNYICNCKVDGAYTIENDEDGTLRYKFNGFGLKEGDGICIYAGEDSKPDYKIIAIKPYKPLYMEVEKI